MPFAAQRERGDARTARATNAWRACTITSKESKSVAKLPLYSSRQALDLRAT
jgi:hypothetical protein